MRGEGPESPKTPGTPAEPCPQTFYRFELPPENPSIRGWCFELCAGLWAVLHRELTRSRCLPGYVTIALKYTYYHRGQQYSHVIQRIAFRLYTRQTSRSPACAGGAGPQGYSLETGSIALSARSGVGSRWQD